MHFKNEQLKRNIALFIYTRSKNIFNHLFYIKKSIGKMSKVEIFSVKNIFVKNEVKQHMYANFI